MHNKKPLIPIILLLLIAAGIAYWWFFVRVVVPENLISGSGTIEATTVTVSAEASGKILEIKVDEGDKVASNQELAKIEETQLQNRVEQAKTDISSAAENLDKLEAGAESVDIKVYEVITDSAKIALDDTKKSNDDVIASTEKDLAVAQATVDNTLKTRNFALQERQEALNDYNELVLKYEHPIWHIPNYTASQETEVDAAKATADAAYSTFLTAENAYKAALEAYNQAEKKAQSARTTANASVDAADGNYKKALAQLKQAKKPTRKQDVEVAKNAVSNAEKRLESILTDLDKTTVRASLSGVVLSKAVEAGELASTGKTLFEIGDLNKVELSIYVPEAKLGLLKLGQNAQVSVDSYPHRTWTGKITKISDKAEFTPTNIQTKEQRVTTVFEVVISIVNQDQALKPGMPADAEIQLTDESRNK